MIRFIARRLAIALGLLVVLSVIVYFLLDLALDPLEDEANVDTRRAEVGLPPLAEYVKQLEAVYGPAKK